MPPALVPAWGHSSAAGAGGAAPAVTAFSEESWVSPGTCQERLWRPLGIGYAATCQNPSAPGKRVPRSALVSARSFSATPPNPDAPEPDSSRQHPHQAEPYLHIVGVPGSGNAEYDPEHAEQQIASSDRTPPPHLFPAQSGWGGIWHEDRLPRWCARKRRASRADAPARLPPQARTPEPAPTGPPRRNDPPRAGDARTVSGHEHQGDEAEPP